MAKVTSKFQVTVPRAIVDRYKIRPGDEIQWAPAGDAIRVTTGRSVSSTDPALRLRLFDQAAAEAGGQWMSGQSELDRWRAAWTAVSIDTRPPFDFRAAAERQERGLRIRYILNVAFAACLIAFPLWILRGNSGVEALAWSAAVWLTTLGVTIFQIWNWRDLWRTSTRSASDYAAIYQSRCLAALRAVRFGYAFLALQLAIAGPWLTWDYLRGELPSMRYAFGIGMLAALTIAFLVWFRASGRRSHRELAEVNEYLSCTTSE